MTFSPLRICFISTQYPPGLAVGIGRFTADLARGFAAAGHDVHVMTAQSFPSTVTFEDGVWVHRFPPYPFAVEALRNEAAYGDLLRMASVYREVVAEHRVQAFDIISSPIWFAEGLLVAMDPRFVSVVSLHTTTQTHIDVDESVRAAAESGPRAKLERRCIHVHHHTHANSAASLARTTEDYGRVNGAFIVHHGIQDKAPRFPRRRKHDGRLRILVTGRLEIRKGSDLLLAVMPALLARFTNVEFVLVGPTMQIRELEGKTIPEAFAEQIPAGSDWSTRVRFTGVVSDEELFQNYADADIFLFPSRFESFGLCVVEAMSFGLPVVACKAGGVREIVEHANNGLLTDVGDWRGLVSALCDLILDAETRQQYGAASRTRYLSNFCMGVSVPRTIAAYQTVISDHKASVSTLTAAPLAERFAEAIEEVTACRGAAAIDAARRLIGDTTWKVEQPQVAVIVTCFNYERYVVQALQSVAAQTYRDFECIVVDDASTDNSAKVIERWIADHKDPRFRMIQNESNRGQTASFAAGLAASNGELVAFFDADDIWFPDFLQEHVNVHRYRIPSASVSCSDLVQIDREQRIVCGTYGNPPHYAHANNARQGFISIAKDKRLRDSSYEMGDSWQGHWPAGNFLPIPWSVTSGMMFRRNLLDVVMPQDPASIRICTDGYLFVLCNFFTGSHAIKRPLGAYRRHGKNNFGSLPVFGYFHISVQGKFEEQCRILIPAMLHCLLDRYDDLSARFTTARVRTLMRRLYRQCLRDGLPFKSSRLPEVLGYGKVFRDRIRAKVPYLGRRLM